MRCRAGRGRMRTLPCLRTAEGEGTDSAATTRCREEFVSTRDPEPLPSQEAPQASARRAESALPGGVLPDPRKLSGKLRASVVPVELLQRHERDDGISIKVQPFQKYDSGFLCVRGETRSIKSSSRVCSCMSSCAWVRARLFTSAVLPCRMTLPW